MGGLGTAPLASLRLLNMSYSPQWLGEIGFMSNRKNAGVVVTDGQQARRHDYIPLSRQLVYPFSPSNDRLRSVLLLELSRGRVSRRIATELYEQNAHTELRHLLSFFYDTVSSPKWRRQLTFDLLHNLTYLANVYQPLHHRASDGLRHHRHRARPRAGQDQEAGRRRHHVHRQPDRAPGPAPARLLRRAGRGHRRLHRRAQVDRRRAAPAAASTCPSSPARWATTPSTTGATSA